MIYVVEGLDRCGKTTFIECLRSKITNPELLVIHSSKPPKQVDNTYWSISYYDSLISKALESSYLGYDIILDRAWLGETVYGPIYRNTSISLSRLEHNIFHYQDSFKLFLFVDSPENLLSREDGLSLSSNIKDKQKEKDLFIDAFNNSKIKDKTLIDWSKIDFSNDFLNKLAEGVIV